MNIIDLIIVAFFAYHAVVGFKKGLSKIVFDLAGIIVGFLVGYNYYELIGLFFETQFNLAPPYSYFTSFCLIWLGIYFIVSFFGKFIEKVLSLTGVNIINRLLGSVFNILISSFKLMLLIVPLLFMKSPLAQTSYFITTSKPVIMSLFETHLPSATDKVHQLKQTSTELINHVN
jgi:membrane protein required for colicin V production